MMSLDSTLGEPLLWEGRENALTRLANARPGAVTISIFFGVEGPALLYTYRKA
jgi:hypothetical protein